MKISKYSYVVDMNNYSNQVKSALYILQTYHKNLTSLYSEESVKFKCEYDFKYQSGKNDFKVEFNYLESEGPTVGLFGHYFNIPSMCFIFGNVKKDGGFLNVSYGELFSDGFVDPNSTSFEEEIERYKIGEYQSIPEFYRGLRKSFADKSKTSSVKVNRSEMSVIGQVLDSINSKMKSTVSASVKSISQKDLAQRDVENNNFINGSFPLSSIIESNKLLSSLGHVERTAVWNSPKSISAEGVDLYPSTGIIMKDIIALNSEFPLLGNFLLDVFPGVSQMNSLNQSYLNNSRLGDIYFNNDIEINNFSVNVPSWSSTPAYKNAELDRQMLETQVHFSSSMVLNKGMTSNVQPTISDSIMLNIMDMTEESGESNNILDIVTDPLKNPSQLGEYFDSIGMNKTLGLIQDLYSKSGKVKSTDVELSWRTKTAAAIPFEDKKIKVLNNDIFSSSINSDLVVVSRTYQKVFKAITSIFK